MFERSGREKHSTKTFLGAGFSLHLSLTSTLGSPIISTLMLLMECWLCDHQQFARLSQKHLRLCVCVLHELPDKLQSIV
jgi:hypothetical protein